MLLAAAGLKGLDAVSNPLAAGPIIGTRWELLAVMEAELLLGLALILGLYPQTVRWLAIGCFSLFAGVNLYQTLAGASSCGCFGPISIHPTYTLLLDLVALAALGCWRPAATAPRLAGNVIGLALGGFALLAVGAGAPATAQPDDLDSPGEVAVLNPREWVGQPFPLLGRLAGGTGLQHGEWVIVFHRQGCHACAVVMEELQGLVEQGRDFGEPVRLACVEVPSDDPAPIREPLPGCEQLHLRSRREWLTKAPVCVRLSSGHTEAVAENVNELRRWFTR